MPASAKVSIEPVIATPTTKKVIRKVIRKLPAAAPIPVEPVSSKQGKKYADASSGVPLEVLNQRLLIIGIVFGVITILTTVGLFYFRTQVKFDDVSDIELPEIEEEVIENEQVIATTEPVSGLTRSEITIEILNGSGISGLAGDTALEFQELGYDLPVTGNSENVEVTEVYVSNEYSEEEISVFLRDLDRRLGVEEITDYIEDLDTTVRIILGEDQS